MFYYAVLNSSAVVSRVEASDVAITDDPHYIEITEDQYNNYDTELRNKSYDAYTKTFVTRIYWSCAVGEVHDNSQVLGLKLSDRLSMIEDKVTIDIKSINISSTLSNPSVSSVNVTLEGSIVVPEKAGTYLVSVKYRASNGLVDQSTYVVYFTGNRGLVSTYNLVKCYSSSDSLVMIYNNGTLTASLTYNSPNTTIVAADIKFI